MLRECINSVYQKVPVNNLIIVDGYFTDATAENNEGHFKVRLHYFDALLFSIWRKHFNLTPSYLEALAGTKGCMAMKIKYPSKFR